MDSDWGDDIAMPEGIAERLADTVGRLFCHCGNSIRVSCLWSNGTWKMLYACSKILDGQELSGHIQEEVTPDTLEKLQDKTLRDHIMTIRPRQFKGRKAFGSLSTAQIENILINPILERTVNKCPLCQTVGPMVVWQLSLKEMRFACICTTCKQASDMRDVVSCS